MPRFRVRLPTGPPFCCDMKDTKSKGDTCEGIVMATLLRLGKPILLPFGENLRYDLVVDEDGKFTRIQCKSGLLKNGVISFRTCSSHYHRGGTSRDYRGEADLFGVYCPQNGKVYLIPVEDAPGRRCHLRVDSTRNNQAKGIRLASDYEVAGIAQLEERLIGNEEVVGSTPASGSILDPRLH